MRLEAMVIGGIANDGAAPGHVGEPFERCIIGREQGFLDQEVLAVAEQMAQQLDLGIIRGTDERRVINAKRHIG